MGARGRGQRGTASRSHLIVGAGVSQRGWGGSWSPEDEMRSAEGKRPKRGPGRVLGKGVGEGRSPQPLGLWTSGSQMGKLPLGREACLESLGRGCGPASLLLQHTWCGPAPGPWRRLRPLPGSASAHTSPFQPQLQGLLSERPSCPPPPRSPACPGRHSPLCPHGPYRSLKLSCLVLCSLVSDTSSSWRE